MLFSVVCIICVDVGRSTYVEVGDVLSVQGPVDGQLSGDGFDEEDAGGGLICSWASDAVAERAVLIVVGPDLLKRQGVRSHFNHVRGVLAPPNVGHHEDVLRVKSYLLSFISPL